MGMTIDEAIKHCEEVANTNDCHECAEEHRQLAEWLRKYQKIEEIVKAWNDMNSFDSMKQISEEVEDGNYHE